MTEKYLAFILMRKREKSVGFSGLVVCWVFFSLLLTWLFCFLILVGWLFLFYLFVVGFGLLQFGI